ncbi:membrane dipeptidase-domain-containing protein [Circinella umbellata]|nr:membrane dipeptidase-domain-containing protein [Circinella umbellata]
MQYINNLFLPSIPNPTVDVGNHVYRHRDAQDGLIKSPIFPRLKDNECTIYHVWNEVSTANAHKPGFGHRELVKIHSQEKKNENGETKRWNMYELEDYRWKTFGQAKEATDNVSEWLFGHGLEPGDCMLIYAKTRPEWIQMALACCSMGVIISTAYDSMPPEAVAHIIQETQPKAVFTEVALMGNLNKAKDKAASKKHEPSFFVYCGKDFEAAEQLNKFKSQNNNIDLTHWDDIVNKNDNGGKQKKKKQQQTVPKPDDVALIMYTSGTTGAPKGIELTHGNIVAAMGAAEHLVMDLLNHGNHCYIGFLPLAHVLEFIIEFILISTGIPIGYATARTLMPGSVCGKDGKGKGKGDLEILSPTIMAGVPAIWERIRNSVLGELEKQHWTVKKAFEVAIDVKWKMLCFFGQENALTRAFDYTLFAPVRAKLGGRLMYAVSGGAPLSLNTHKFVTTTLCYLLQGYGLTECCGLGAITVPALGMITGAIGPPSPSVEFKLVDVPDTDYKAENGIGELYIRGPSRMHGYYKRPDLNKEAFDEDGWFKTGDVAQLRSDGSFAITDRAKNLVKLSHGEYIALESLESKYRNNQKIKHICIQANSNKDYIIALVEAVDENADKDALLKELQNTAREADCNRVEIIKNIFITKDVDWGQKYMSNSGKLKRKDIEKDYEEEIKKIYNILLVTVSTAVELFGYSQQSFLNNLFPNAREQQKHDNEKSYLEQANKLLAKHPVVDTHNDFPMYLAFLKGGKINDLDLTHLEDSHTDITKLKAGHVLSQVWSIYAPCEMTEENQMLLAFQAIDSIKRVIAKYPDFFEYVTTTHEFVKARRHGKLASALGLEGGQYIYNSFAALRTFYDLGIRYMTLTHNCNTDWSISCCDPNPPSFDRSLGLTKFGHNIVREMNRIGMMVDISHVAHSTMHAVLNTTRAPVLFSHSSSNALCPIERNVPDSVLSRLDETDGVVMVNFYNAFVQCDPNTPATLNDVADHIEYIASIAGRHRVGLGADYNGIEKTPEGLEDVSKYPDLFAELIRRGWTKKELKGLSNENFLRVWKRVEEVSKELKDELPFEEDITIKV